MGSGRISTVHNPEEYDRDRWGFGAKYLRNGWRATAEYMEGDGMIWQAPHNPTYGIGPGQGIPGAPGNGADAEGVGYYVEGGYRIPKTRWEFDLRYDQYNRLDGNQFEIEFTRTTLGVQYFFNPRVRLAVNYEIREGEAVNFPGGAGPNGNVDGIDNRIAVQLTGIWSQ
jgi:predicted porin